MKHQVPANAKIEITKDGPYLVSGNLPLSEQAIVTNAEGESLDYHAQSDDVVSLRPLREQAFLRRNARGMKY